MTDHTVYRLNKQMEAAHALREALATDDEDLLRDCIEGETSLQEMIGATVLSMDEDTILAGGLKEHVDALSQRLTRIKKRIETKRAAIEQAMVIGEVKSLELPTMTVSVKKRPDGLQITDEAAIPADWWKPQDPKLDKRALLTALKGGAAIPGAQLDNGGVSLQMRRN